jgi:hypothetical protein
MKQVQLDPENLGSFRKKSILQYFQDLSENSYCFKRYSLQPVFTLTLL